jgi:hypothetical protein
MVLDEPAHGDVLEMPDSPEHRKTVLFIVNCALDWVDERYKLRDRLMTSRALITGMREKSPTNARSLRLRDAERYLWGRAYVIQKMENKSNQTVAEAEAVFADDAYQTMKAGLMAANAVFGTKWGLSNPSNPFSALGGGKWYDLGVKHYLSFDKAHLDEVVEPHRLAEADLKQLETPQPRGPQQRWR